MQLDQAQVQAKRRPASRQKLGRLARQEEREFYLFISPWIIGFVLFGAGPIIASAVLSFMNWSLLSTPTWAGLANYQRLFNDPLFGTTVKNTLVYAVGSVFLGVVVGFLLALLLNQKVWGIAIFRTIFYLPSVVAGVATALLWINIFHPDFGLVNYALGQIGIQGPGWLQSPQWAMPALIIMSAWGAGGGMVIYLAGLQSIPEHLYEAAGLDGAGPLRKFWHITIPMMSPVIFFNLIVGFISSLQAFVLILVMTGPSFGGPANSTMVYGLYLYINAFRFFEMGYASAMAWVLFGVIMIVTAIQFRLSRYWVYYEGGLKG
jgi:multiple sugar transport system permease protein